MQLPTVTNMTSPASGSPVANQFIIDTPTCRVFQSYSTIIAAIDYDDSQVYLDEQAWNYSVTTSKYRNRFLGTDTKTTKARIADGTYKLTNLNDENPLNAGRRA